MRDDIKPGEANRRKGKFRFESKHTHFHFDNLRGAKELNSLSDFFSLLKES